MSCDYNADLSKLKEIREERKREIMSGEYVFTRRTTISSRHTGPIYSNSYALKGIPIYYQPPIPIPDPIVLPVGWTPPNINENNLTFDLSKERQVIEQANNRRQAIAGEVSSPYTSLRTINSQPLIPLTTSTAILTPIPAPTTDEQPSSTVNIPLGEMSLKDFEGEIDPFEATALQAIDVYSELQSVLQQPPAPPTSAPPTSAPPTSAPPISISTPPTSNSSPLLSHSPVAPPPPVYSPPYPDTTGLYETIGHHSGLLVDVGGNTTTEPPPIYYPPPPPSSSSTTTSNRIPPPVAPKPSPRVSPAHSPNPTQRRVTGGIAVLPLVPPPYSSEPNSYSPYTPPVTDRQVYSLPDIRSTLNPEEKSSLNNISSMGFPSPRVARAIKQFEGDNQKVFDFLFQVGEVEEKGYSGDSGETALLAHQQDLEKSLDYLKQVYQYKEVWPEVKIHEAYQEANGSWEQTVDILTQGI